MPRPEKVQAVEEIRERLAEARAMFVTEYRGLSVSEQQSLRAELRKADGDYKVVKMSLARLAADAEGLEALHDALSGPTALAFARSDAATVAKALRDFAKEHESLIIKAGVLSGEVLAPEKVAELADIEPRDVLLGRVAGGFKAPLTKLAGLLEALPRNAASMFSQLLEKKEEEPTAEPEAATETASAEPEAEAAEPTTDEAEPEAEEPAAEAETEQVAEEKPIEEVEPEAEEPVAEADEPAAGEADEPVAESAEAGDEPEAEPVAEEEPATDAEAGEEAADESEEEEE